MTFNGGTGYWYYEKEFYYIPLDKINKPIIQWSYIYDL